jgi:hypothetical protein
VAAFCTPGDLAVLRVALEASEGFEPMTEEERADAIAATADEEIIFPIPTA